MYAIVDIAGQQFKVEKDQKIFVHRLEGEEGSKVDFDQVLLVDNDGKISVGDPVVKDTVVNASIISHVKSDKVLVFKKKRRKGYKKLNGHRQQMTEILIEGIGAGKAKPAAKKEAAPKKAEPKKETADKEVKEAEPKAKAPAKKAEPKKETAAKKPAEKKAPAKKTAAPKAEAKPAEKKETKKAAPKTEKSDDAASEEK